MCVGKAQAGGQLSACLQAARGAGPAGRGRCRHAGVRLPRRCCQALPTPGFVHTSPHQTRTSRTSCAPTPERRVQGATARLER